MTGQTQTGHALYLWIGGIRQSECHGSVFAFVLLSVLNSGLWCKG